MNNKIIVETFIDAPIEKIWQYWNEPEHISQWASASDDWHAPRAINDLRVGGRFNTRMESKDGKEGFDFEGTYTKVEEHKSIEYKMDDGREVKVEFVPEGSGYKVIETFDPETLNPDEMQRAGWQAILDNFKKHVGQ